MMSQCVRASMAVAILGLLVPETARPENDLGLQVSGACCLQVGAAVEVWLSATDLPQSVCGVQVVILYDPNSLVFVGMSPGDGKGSPWDLALEIFEDATAGEVRYALGLIANGTQQDATCARAAFTAVAAGSSFVGPATVSSSDPGFMTKLTRFPQGSAVYPNLGGAVSLDVTLGVPSDLNSDGWVDGADFARLTACFGGPAGAMGDGGPDPGCCCADLTGDVDVDMADFSAFQRAFTGPSN
jgi:hypothetical protein